MDRENPHTPRCLGIRVPFSLKSVASAALCLGIAVPALASDLSYLQSLLDTTAQGGWVMASTAAYSSAWVSGSSALPDASHTNPGSVVRAWSSIAWDSTRGNLLLWGGGHANYMGNEMYIWQGSDGTWTRGSVSSRIEQAVNAEDPRTYLVVDDAAPQSAHTYDNNVYLPVNDRFVTFGGATYNSAGAFQVRDGNGNLVNAGPWMWDPSKADANKVGGTTGSGYDRSVVGGNMWENRMSQSTGVAPANFIQGSTAYRTENGKDVVYVMAPAESSGWPGLWRYTVGDLAHGGTDTWERIGVSANAPAGQNAATLDTAHNLFVHTSAVTGYGVDLGVWDLAHASADNPGIDTAITLVEADGTAFEMSTDYGIDFDEASGKYYLWDGHGAGTVWMTEALYGTGGSLETTWVITKLASTTADAPSGNFVAGVNGKWKYVAELGAYIALNEYDVESGDAEVWLYKPFAEPVPEPATYAMLLAGLGLIGWRAGRRSRT